ncbi:DNA primase [Chelatococcus sp. SYSU_G07232]|uniref:DNA primase n=1 Tax=Chelatococcus albus TaxID=3047466 RepID=A0ABT7AIM8_9HYPH|nr:DNA primase [Chelatococcus sp. SYSU_G07232]MDJ1159222.1 DNA primase [Chelatococcus sp. SYSU_G07232]
MRYPPSVLEEIRSRLPVTAVVGKRVRLQKAGREWKGLSPFNAEKTPSFYVNDQKGFYHCFSSGKHGDIFTFLMEVEGLSFPEAVERLAAEAGVTLPKLSREAERVEEERKSLHQVLELACAFFEATLQGREGGKARGYLAGRGLGPEIQKRFRLGYAPPERFALRDHLAATGVPPQMMIDAGLLVAGEEINVPYDRFRDRVMFPICDARGRVVAFGGRAMSADVPAKYLNSPETPLFHKGSLLYNHHNARKAAHDRGTVIAVEGYVDVIAMSAVGFPHAVAPLGTALTEEQLALLWRMADEPILCFDGDRAGRKAAFRAIDVALPLLQPGKSLRFALLPEGQDPDDLSRSGGAAAIDAVLAGARPLVDVLWAREVERAPLDTPERRAALERRIGDLLSHLKDETLRRHYRAEIGARLAGLMPGVIGPRRGAGRPPTGHRGGGDARGRFLPAEEPLRASPALARHPLFAAAGRESPREALILLALLAHPPLLLRHCEMIAGLELTGAQARRLRARMVDVAASEEEHDSAALRDRIAEAGLGAVLVDLERVVRPGDRWALAPDADIDAVYGALHQAVTLHRRAHTLHTELRAAERALAEEESETNLAWLLDVRAQISSLEGTEADVDGVKPEGQGVGLPS